LAPISAAKSNAMNSRAFSIARPSAGSKPSRDRDAPLSSSPMTREARAPASRSWWNRSPPSYGPTSILAQGRSPFLNTVRLRTCSTSAKCGAKWSSSGKTALPGPQSGTRWPRCIGEAGPGRLELGRTSPEEFRKAFTARHFASKWSHTASSAMEQARGPSAASSGFGAFRQLCDTKMTQCLAKAFAPVGAAARARRLS